MKILLLDPAVPYPVGPQGRRIPLGLAYLAASLRQAGHEVRIQNRLALQALHRLSVEALDQRTARLLREFQPDLVGLSGTTTSFADIRALAALTSALLPRATIILGGPHASIVPEETLALIPEAECLLVGEGEVLLPHLASGRPPSELPGMYWREEVCTLRSNPWQPSVTDLDALPHPARDLLDMKWYTSWDNWAVRGLPGRSLTMLSSRGCPHHQCAFCCEPAWTVRGVRYHSPEYTVAEAEDVLRRWPVGCLQFLDEMFTADRSRVLALCNLWQQRGLHRRVVFTIQARADALDEEVLRALKAAGCFHIEIGVESGSPRMLDVMQKGATLEQNRWAVAAVKAAGLRVQANLVPGCPGETEEDFRQSVAFIEETQPDVVSWARFTPHPGTAFARQLIGEGRLAPDFWVTDQRAGEREGYDFAAMPPGRFEALFRQVREEGILTRNQAAWAARVPWWRALRRALTSRLSRRKP